jgi:hypothetical protein
MNDAANAAILFLASDDACYVTGARRLAATNWQGCADSKQGKRNRKSRGTRKWMR